MVLHISTHLVTVTVHHFNKVYSLHETVKMAHVISQLHVYDDITTVLDAIYACRIRGISEKLKLAALHAFT